LLECKLIIYTTRKNQKGKKNFGALVTHRARTRTKTFDRVKMTRSHNEKMYLIHIHQTVYVTPGKKLMRLYVGPPEGVGPPALPHKAALALFPGSGPAIL